MPSGLLTGLGAEAGDERAQTYTRREVVLRLTAALAVICGVIHIGAGVDHFDEFALYTVVFSGLAVAQIAWAALLVWRPSTAWLTLGCALQVGIVALWVASRTTGVPIAPKAWVPEEIGIADAVETFCELSRSLRRSPLLLETRSAARAHDSSGCCPPSCSRPCSSGPCSGPVRMPADGTDRTSAERGGGEAAAPACARFCRAAAGCRRRSGTGAMPGSRCCCG